MTALLLLLVACDRSCFKDCPADDTDPVVDDSDGVTDSDDTDDTDPDDTDPPHVRCATPAGFEIGANVFASLQDALDAAQAGDTIVVCPGTWPVLDAIWRGEGPLTLQGSTNVPAAHVLVGAGDRPTLQVLGDAPDLTIRDLSFNDADAWFAGAALHIRANPNTAAGRLHLDHVAFAGNVSHTGVAAVWTLGLIDVELDHVDVRDNIGLANAAVLIDGARGYVAVRGSSFSSNRSGRTAGLSVFRFDNHPGRLEVLIEQSSFLDNVAELGAVGSALNVASESPGPTNIRLDGNTFAHNDVDPFYGDYPFGAVWLGNAGGISQMSATLIDNAFDDNNGMWGAHLTVTNADLDTTFEVSLSGGSMTRAWHVPVYPWDQEIWVGAAVTTSIDPWLPDVGPVHLTLTDVDMGSGPTANQGLPFDRCLTPYEGAVSGVISPTDEDWCP